MGCDLQNVKLSMLAAINPTRKVKKGTDVPFIDMAALPTHGRDIQPAAISHRRAKGAGAHFRNGDTLLARITPCLENGKTAQVSSLGEGEVAEGSTEFIVLVGQDPSDNDYVYYLCRDPSFRDFAIKRMEGTSGRQRVSWQSIAKYEFECPGPESRRSAATMLSILDDRINLLRQTNTTLEAIAQALFKSWFVDFDPVHAKTEGRPPEAMDAATAALFPSEFESSELGLIPKGWCAGTLDDLSQLNAMSWSSKRHPDTISYVDLSGVHENRIGKVNDLPFSDAPSRARRSLQDGDTIVGTVRPGNRAFAYIHRPAASLTGSTGFAVLSPKDEASAPFVYLAATRNDSIERLANLADGGAYPAVRPGVVSATPVVIPPASVIAAFSRITAPMLHKIGENRNAEATLVELCDTLLPCLISGKLRLPKARSSASVEAEVEVH